jgi:hypothetical protein
MVETFTGCMVRVVRCKKGVSVGGWKTEKLVVAMESRIRKALMVVRRGEMDRTAREVHMGGNMVAVFDWLVSGYGVLASRERGCMCLNRWC